ncbi:MAG: hypothetical protein AB1847_17930 [bacterium]
MDKRSSSPSQGFSLIEVIVSILFLMIAITGLMTLYTSMSSQVEWMRWKRNAMLVAQKSIEELVADPNVPIGPIETVDVFVTPFQSVKSTLEMTQPDPHDPKTIECKVKGKWNDRDVSVSLRTIVGR